MAGSSQQLDPSVPEEEEKEREDYVYVWKRTVQAFCPFSLSTFWRAEVERTFAGRGTFNVLTCWKRRERERDQILELGRRQKLKGSKRERERDRQRGVEGRESSQWWWQPEAPSNVQLGNKRVLWRGEKEKGGGRKIEGAKEVLGGEGGKRTAHPLM